MNDIQNQIPVATPVADASTTPTSVPAVAPTPASAISPTLAEGATTTTDVVEAVVDVNKLVSDAGKQVAVPPKSMMDTETPIVSKTKVEVVADKCIGCGSCIGIAPEIFKLNDVGKSEVISQDGADDETKMSAAKSCPADAIIVTDTKKNQQIWPES